MKESSGWDLIRDEQGSSFPIFSTRISLRRNRRSGATYDFFLIEGLHWVNVIALTSDNEVVLVRQYRHGAEEHTLEIPGGCIDPGEAPEKTALRELEEETGYRATSLTHLGTVLPNPALMSIKCHMYLARDVEKKSLQKLDPGEDIEVVLLPFTEVLEGIRSGSINHSLVIAAFGHLLLREGAGKF